MCKSLCADALSKYPTSYQEDIEMLAADDETPKLTQNQRSCLLFRMGEKKILHYLIGASEKLEALGKMNVKEARKELNLHGQAKYGGMMDYVKNVFISDLLAKAN